MTTPPSRVCACGATNWVTVKGYVLNGETSAVWECLKCKRLYNFSKDIDTKPPSWKRFRDAPPPDGLYWSRYADDPPAWYTIVEVEGNLIKFLGSDLYRVCQTDEFGTADLREYYTQSILPPS